MARALRHLDSIQVDSLNVIGHSQDLVLWGRIDGYRIADLESALYRQRTVFEWGGNLQIRPIEELPYLRIVMQRITTEDRWLQFARVHADRISAVVRAIEREGPLSGRDFKGKSVTRPGSFRGGTEATQALYYLWLKGDVMVESRRRGAKVYDLTSRLFPKVTKEAPVEEAEERIILQTLRDLGLATATEWLAHAHGRIRRSSLRYEWKARVRRWSDLGVIRESEFSGLSGRRWFLAEAASELEAVRTGHLPRGWRPVSTTTLEEVVFLSPFDQSTANGRSQRWFDFEMVSEFYKPAAKRRWGYYTLPILFGDSLVARVDMRFEAESKSIRVLGFWPDDPKIRGDAAFAVALGKAFARLAGLHSATSLDLSPANLPKIRPAVEAAFREAIRTGRVAV